MRDPAIESSESHGDVTEHHEQHQQPPAPPSRNGDQTDLFPVSILLFFH